jgi:hypothetical protein
LAEQRFFWAHLLADLQAVLDELSVADVRDVRVRQHRMDARQRLYPFSELMVEFQTLRGVVTVRLQAEPAGEHALRGGAG